MLDCCVNTQYHHFAFCAYKTFTEGASNCIGPRIDDENGYVSHFNIQQSSLWLRVEKFSYLMHESPSCSCEDFVLFSLFSGFSLIS